MKEITLYLILSFFLIRQINAQEVVSAEVVILQTLLYL